MRIGARLAVLAVAAAGLGWLLWPVASARLAEHAGPDAGVATPGRPMFSAPGATNTNAPMTAAERAAAQALWQERAARARAALEGYRKTTMYPFNSRPAAENADQLYPNRPVTEDRPLNNGSDEADPSIHILTSQSRVFVASGEDVVFTIAARDDEGKRLPLEVTSARASGLPNATNASPPSVAMRFNDQGLAGDAQADDGTQSATLLPAMTGLSAFDGTIRVELAFRAGERTGQHIFDVVYSPQPPAVWAGPFKDSLEAGSLVLRVPVEVRQAGRYIINARIDDASGKAFALATFNDELAAGTKDVALTVFGKLIRDAKPSFPLAVRDVDGYLLREQGHPDRALMPRLMGVVRTTANYSLSSFSDAEWQSEERNRYLTEYGKDLDDAQRQLAALNAGQ
ncbi:hypothetical protein [Niveibacterium sp.]|uniref:hypothetical protein n=1 Tax=Niveibacterium sp. TaxID=2017444 RepID=UPI0035B46ED0